VRGRAGVVGVALHGQLQRWVSLQQLQHLGQCRFRVGFDGGPAGVEVEMQRGPPFGI
jgi:hypothetical protein